MKRLFLKGLRYSLFLLAYFPVAVFPVDDSMDARAVVALLHQNLLQSMQAAETWGQQQRYMRLAQIIGTTFDNKYITKIVLGKYWRGLTEEERQQFIRLLTRLNIATYATRFNKYDNESFIFFEEKKLRNGKMLVKTGIEQGDNQPTVALDYLLDSGTGQWKIIGVIANGINELSLKRAEYSSIFKEKGKEKLIEKIKDKIDATKIPFNRATHHD